MAHLDRPLSILERRHGPEGDHPGARHAYTAEGPEPMAATPSPPGETKVRRQGGDTHAPWSLNQETPATNPIGGERRGTS